MLTISPRSSQRRSLAALRRTPAGFPLPFLDQQSKSFISERLESCTTFQNALVQLRIDPDLDDHAASFTLLLAQAALPLPRLRRKIERGSFRTARPAFRRH